MDSKIKNVVFDLGGVLIIQVSQVALCRLFHSA